MSLENNLKRIADSLEKLVKQGELSFAEKAAEAGLTDAVGSVEQTAAAAPAPSVQSESASEANPPAGAAAAVNTAQPVAAPQPAPAQPAAPAAAPVTALTAEEMNAALVAEFNRIGDRAPIDAVMQGMGITGVAELPAEKQQELLTAVRAIPGKQ